MPSYLLGARGVGSEKREQVLELLKEDNLKQKEIACQVGVSAATVTRIKQEYAEIKSGKIVSKIITANPEYPTSDLSDKNEPVTPVNQRKKAVRNYGLIKILKKELLKNCDENYLKQMSAIYYYKIRCQGIRFKVVNIV